MIVFSKIDMSIPPINTSNSPEGMGASTTQPPPCDKPKGTETLKIEYNIMGSMTIQLNNTFGEFHLTQFPYPDIGALRAIFNTKPPSGGGNPAQPGTPQEAKTPDPRPPSQTMPPPPTGTGSPPSGPLRPPQFRNLPTGPGPVRTRLQSYPEEKQSPSSESSGPTLVPPRVHPPGVAGPRPLPPGVTSPFYNMEPEQIFNIYKDQFHAIITGQGDASGPEGYPPLPGLPVLNDLSAVHPQRSSSK
jgi:hypothetical protein